MHGRSTAATAWLGLTPEPERSLPELLAYLQDASTVSSEQSRVTRLVLRGTGRRWLRYLDRAAGLALEIADGSRDGDPELAAFARAEGSVYNRRPGSRRQPR